MYGCKICSGQTHVNDQCRAIESEAKRKQFTAANWMTEIEAVQQRSLNDITLPGAHDAAMSGLDTCLPGANSWNTKTQKLSITDMLEAGVRYFDIRPLVMQSGFVTHIAAYHGSKGPKNTFLGCWDDTLVEIMREFAVFASAHREEVILIEFSHIKGYRHTELYDNLYDATGEQLGFIKNIIVKTLGTSLTKNYPDLRTVLATPLIDLTAVGNVVVMVDTKDNNLWAPNEGIFFKHATNDQKEKWDDATIKANPFIYDDYSNASKIHVLVDGGKSHGGSYQDPQQVKMEKALNDGQYAMMSWTPTHSTVMASRCGLRNCPYPPGTLEEMALEAHIHLPAVLDKIRASGKFPDVISLDYIDRVQAEKIFDLNRR